MKLFTVGDKYKREISKTVTSDQLSLIGYVGVWSNRLQRYPLPLLAVDRRPRIIHFNTAVRVEGLLPSEWDDDHLIEGDWTGQVDIKSGKTFGEGEVYLGNANTPSSTEGYVFKEPIPFNPGLELGFVTNPGNETVLREKTYRKIDSYLIYADPFVLNVLGRVHDWNKF